MEIYVDSANVEEIKSALWFPLRGITTNPTIVAKEHRPLGRIMEQLLEFGLAELHCQVLGNSTEEMVAEAKMLIKEAPGRIIPKIPVTPQGLAAISKLSSDGQYTTATGIYTLGQGVLAARAGARFVAPYVNRIDSLGGSGCAVAGQIRVALKQYGLPAKVIAASVKTACQFQNLLEGGVDSVTVTAQFLQQIVSHSETERAVLDFQENWLKTYQNSTLEAQLRD